MGRVFVRRFVGFGFALLSVFGAASCADDPVESSDSRSGDPVSASIGDDVSLVARTQEVIEGGITVDSVELKAAGYVAVFENAEGAPGRLVGASELLAAGIHKDVVVDFADVDFDVSDSVFVIPHGEDGENDVFDYPDADFPLSDDSGVALVEVDLS